jgi:hypothetical protein
LLSSVQHVLLRVPAYLFLVIKVVVVIFINAAKRVELRGVDDYGSGRVLEFTPGVCKGLD